MPSRVPVLVLMSSEHFTRDNCVLGVTVPHGRPAPSEKVLWQWPRPWGSYLRGRALQLHEAVLQPLNLGDQLHPLLGQQVLIEFDLLQKGLGRGVVVAPLGRQVYLGHLIDSGVHVGHEEANGGLHLRLKGRRDERAGLAISGPAQHTVEGPGGEEPLWGPADSLKPWIRAQPRPVLSQVSRGVGEGLKRWFGL